VKGKRCSGTRVGIFSEGFPFWVWCREVFGEVSWVAGGNKIRDDDGVVGPVERMRTESEVEELMMTRPVDVVLFEDHRPGLRHPVWTRDEVKVVVWFGGPRSRVTELRSKEGWTVSRISLEHHSLGGVTDGRFYVQVAVRTGETAFVLPPVEGLTGKLGHITDPTSAAGKNCAPPEAGSDLDQTDEGLLRWKDRHESVLVRTVFSKPPGRVWRRRRLGGVELLKAGDAPAMVLRSASVSQAERWSTTLRVPFKIRFHVIDGVADWIEGVRKRRGRTQSQPAKKPRLSEQEGGRKQIPLERLPGEPYDQGLGESHGEDAPEVKEKARAATSAKADDAEVPVYLWNDRITKAFPALEDEEKVALGALDIIRAGTLGFWRRKVARDFRAWWKLELAEAKKMGKKADLRSLRKGTEALRYAAGASWWGWEAGSAPFFWRWPPEIRDVIRDGEPPRFIGPPPSYRRPYKVPKDDETRVKQGAKVQKVRRQGYIGPLEERILSLMDFFSVDKAKVLDPETLQEMATDIRMVYNGTSCGLNKCLWAPWFALPTFDQMVRGVEEGGWGADNDFGDMFLNFWLHEQLQKYCGVDLTKLYPEEASGSGGLTLWEVWRRLAMGLKPSPYGAYRGALYAKQVAMGKPDDDANPFAWSALELNLPGDEDYNPGRPWISKRRRDGHIATDLNIYVDDVRNTAPTQELGWQASSKMAKTASFLGLQDAARKKRAPSQDPGPWTGGVAESLPGEAVIKTCTLERWLKTKQVVKDLRDHYEEMSLKAEGGAVLLSHNLLQKKRGFLNYVGRIFTDIVPYLKGLHLTIDGWRDGRDDEGWRLTDGVGEKVELPPDERAPGEVRAVPCFMDDLMALEELTGAEEPPRIPVRPTQLAAVVFAFGDASGAGFGQTSWVQGSEEVEVDFGLWDETYSSRSSNFRELVNQVNQLEDMLRSGRIKKGAEVFLFTDNSTAERTYHRGNSKSRLLYELVLRLRKLRMEGQLFVHLIWVAGTRMIAQGTDGVSRGDLHNGVVGGTSMLSFVPLNRSAGERSPKLASWLRECLPSVDLTQLEPEGWFKEGQLDGDFLWLPPPAIADVALELLCETRHRRPWNTHLFACPAIMTERWRKRLGKVADIMVTLPAGSSIWGSDMHEPVTVAFILPLLSVSPWQVRRAPFAEDFKKAVSGLWIGDCERARDCVRKLWDSAASVGFVQGRLAR